MTAGSDRNRQGPHPLQGRAFVPCDQAAVRLPEDPTAGNAQEPLQDQCAGSIDESVPGTAAITRSSPSVGMVCPNNSIQAQITA